MDKLAEKFLQQVQLLQNTLAQVLEKPSKHNSEKPAHFEVTTDLSGLDELQGDLQGLSETEALQMAFRRLAPYFEAGLLLKSKGSSGSPEMAFRHGNFYPLIPEDRNLTWNIPQFSFAEIKILKAESLKLDFEKIGFVDPQFEDVLAFRILPEWFILVVSKLPEVFLKHHAGKIHEQLLKIFADLDRV